MKSNSHHYIPVLEDISDEDDEEEDLTLETVSSYPNGECSRTSPGNHVTVRRWKQRSARNEKSAADSSLLLSPISVNTPAVLDLSGPSSAPAKIQWEGGQDSRQTITRRPFDISSIVGEHKPDRTKVPKTIFEKSSTRKTSSGQSIPVGIAVGRQREARPEARESSLPSASSSQTMASQSSQPSQLSSLSSPLLHTQTAIAPLPCPPIMPSLTPLPLLPSPSPQTLSLPFQPQWTPGLAGYRYPTNYPPDPSYYLYLQQHLLLLHHQHLQMERQIQISSTQAEEAHSNPHINSYEDIGQHTVVNNNEPININMNTEDKRSPQKANGHKNVEVLKNNFIAQTCQELPHYQDVLEIKKDEVANEVKDLSNKSIKSDNQRKEVNNELNNNESKNTAVNQELINVDDIDDGPEIATDKDIINSNESFIDVEDEKPVGDKCDDTTRGLFLLAEGIECMEKKEIPTRKTRYASTDCCDYQEDSLQILCDVASVQPKQNIGEKHLSPRIERSKSLDSFRTKTDRIQSHTDVKKDIKDFITKTLKKQKKSDLSELKETKSPINDMDDMDAWEIELRIQMADKQRKYNKINKKLLKIKKLKLKSPKIKTKKSHFKTEESNQACKGKGFKPKSNFAETFHKFKKAYLATRPQKEPLLSNSNLCPSLPVEIKTSEENEQNTQTVVSPLSTKKEDASMDKGKKDIEIRKRKHEKFVVAKADHIKKEMPKDIGSDEDFFEYKHKKIRRISKDAETVVKQECAIKESYKSCEDKSMEKNNANLVKFEEYIADEECNGKSIEKKKKKKKDKSKKKKKEKSKNKDRDKKKRESDIEFGVSNIKPLLTEANAMFSCTLQAKDLIDGLRIIKRIGSHFYPGRLTEISAPDIYGIVVDKERGNKPHILTQEEVLNEAVLEVKPRSVSDLKVGDRVCAFWSNQMNYLHPGTVAGPDSDQDFIIIQLDDGDSRDIHIDQVRLLPENYPFVAPSEDSITGLFGSRKRGAAAELQIIDEKRVRAKEEKKAKKATKSKTKSKKKRKYECQWSVSVKEVSESDNDEVKIDSLNLSELPSDDSLVRDDDQDSAFVSTGHQDDSEEEEDNESVDTGSRNISGGDKSAITAFLPPQQLLWSWSDKGYKLSPKARKVYHDIIRKDDETMQVGDCAVFLSTGRPDRPYIGQIDSMWQTTGAGMKVRVRWFYHQAEVEGTAMGGGRVEDIRKEGALFSSSHYDENDVQTISHKCQVMQLEEFTKLEGGMEDKESSDSYYLAGEYDPVEGTIVFAQGVLEN